jgi:hypothetical protein
MGITHQVTHKNPFIALKNVKKIKDSVYGFVDKKEKSDLD